MIIYNVTVKVDREIDEDWREWMKSKHIPDVMDTGKFSDFRLCRLLGQEEEDGVTYAVQYYGRDMDAIREYQELHAPDLQAEHRNRYGDRYVAFRTLLQVLDRSDSAA
ncbi:MAG: DUF4286 family protein [Saprospiraceae bacterium]|nr:DUF4286 family protein [Saprospiraceae bacterium]